MKSKLEFECEERRRLEYAESIEEPKHGRQRYTIDRVFLEVCDFGVLIHVKKKDKHDNKDTDQTEQQLKPP